LRGRDYTQKSANTKQAAPVRRAIA
jgi:hypothetical protein